MVILPRVAVTLRRIYQHFVEIASRSARSAHFTPDKRSLNPFIITAAGSTSSRVVTAWGLTRIGAIPNKPAQVRTFCTSATDGSRRPTRLTRMATRTGSARRQESDYMDFVDFEEVQVRPWIARTEQFIEPITSLMASKRA
jgi:hypothetical protein